MTKHSIRSLSKYAPKLAQNSPKSLLFEVDEKFGL